MTDEQIVAKVQNGDKEAFGEVMTRYQDRLYGYLRNLTNQKQEEVEDLVEEVLVATYINLQSFDTKKKFSSWIFRVAHNKAIDYFKKKKIRTNDLGDSEEMWGDNHKLIEEAEIDLDRTKMINKVVEELDFKYREVIILYYYEDKNYEEISDILRISNSNVGVLLYRAKKILKELLEESINN